VFATLLLGPADTVAENLKDGAKCKVIGGTHDGKSGKVKDIKTGKTGHVSITVVQSDGVRFKTLAKNLQSFKRQGGAAFIQIIALLQRRHFSN
jgi:ribosomal protein S4E